MAGAKKVQKRKKLKKRGRSASLKKEVLRTLDLPVETEASTPKTTMIGRSDLLVENHTGMLHCGHQMIRLITQEGVLQIDGEELALLELAEQRAYIRGKIVGIQYLS